MTYRSTPAFAIGGDVKPIPRVTAQGGGSTCPGCSVLHHNRVTLPRTWTPDDAIPPETTQHFDGVRYFVFKFGDMGRIYL